MKIQAGIFGATGYTGAELARLLIQHPSVELTLLHSRSYAGMRYDEVFGHMRGRTELVCEETTVEECAGRCDVLFLALPHGIASHAVTERVTRECLIVDLGADFRLHDRRIYERWYAAEHGSPELLSLAVYGLPELFRKEIREARLIANPGCYTSASILALAPLYAEGLIDPASVVVDAKSGVTGAGRGLNLPLHFPESNESVKAYKVEAHRHTPEIEQVLSELYGRQITLRFTPHLMPMNRGILAACYARPTEPMSGERLRELYREYYGGERFIRLLPEGVHPETRWVRGSNYLDLSAHYDERNSTVVAVSAIDNLMKGAAGQAVQNMNIRLGLDEAEGLAQIPLFP